MAAIACWMCRINFSGVPRDHTDTQSSTLVGRVSFIEAVVSTASWSSSFWGCMGLAVLPNCFLAHTLGAWVHLGLPCSSWFSWGLCREGSQQKSPVEAHQGTLVKWCDGWSWSLLGHRCALPFLMECGWVVRLCNVTNNSHLVAGNQSSVMTLCR